MTRSGIEPTNPRSRGEHSAAEPRVASYLPRHVSDPVLNAFPVCLVSTHLYRAQYINWNGQSVQGLRVWHQKGHTSKPPEVCSITVLLLLFHFVFYQMWGQNAP